MDREPTRTYSDVWDNLHLVVEQCSDLPGTVACLLHLWNWQIERLELAEQAFKRDIPRALFDFEKIALATGFIGSTARFRRPQICEDTSTGEILPERTLGACLLCVPIYGPLGMVGTITLAGDRPHCFTGEDLRLVSSLVESFVVPIQTQSDQERGLLLAAALSETSDVHTFVRQLERQASELLDKAASIVWLRDRETNVFRAHGIVDSIPLLLEGRDGEVSAHNPGIQEILSVRCAVLRDDFHNKRLLPWSALVTPEWNFLLAVPLFADSQPEGILTSFFRTKESASEISRRLMEALGRNASNVLEQLMHVRKLRMLDQFARVISEARDEHEIHDELIHCGRSLLRARWGLIRGYSLKTGRLPLLRAIPKTEQTASLDSTDAVFRSLIEEGGHLFIDDLQADAWRRKYQPLWEDQRSQLVCPIVLSNCQIRIGSEISKAPKPLGVVAFGSPSPNAFSEFDGFCVESLAKHAAAALDRVNGSRRSQRISDLQTEIEGRRDWDSVLELLWNGIRGIFGYDYVNLSLVDPEGRTLRPIFSDMPSLVTSESAAPSAFLTRILKSQTPEVVYGLSDPGLSPSLSDEGYRGVTRLFMPLLVPPHRSAIGLLEVGQRRSYLPQLYERDILLLARLTDFAAQALMRRDASQLDRISHEIHAPLVAIRANASRLGRRHTLLNPDKVERICADIVSDTDALSFQLRQLEFLLGRPLTFGHSERTRPEPLVLFRDIVIKTVNQLRQMVLDHGLDPNRIAYDPEGVSKLGTVYADRVQLSQVAFNLFMNSVKYAKDPETFRLFIGTGEAPESLDLLFCDWGIGVEEGDEEQIFLDG